MAVFFRIPNHIKNLFRACDNGNIDDVREILTQYREHGVLDAINKRSSIEGLTPVSVAVLMGHLEIVQLLLDNGADLYIKDFQEQLPLHHALGSWGSDMINLMLDRLILDKKCHKINQFDKTGMTPLHWGVMNKNLSGVEAFLSRVRSDPHFTLNINLQTEHGLTPLHYATDEKSLEMVKLLLEHGADPNIKNEDNQSPLDFLNEDDEIRKYILSYQVLP